MNQLHTLVARAVNSIQRRICRIRLGIQRRRDRAELASLSGYELWDIGLSHPDSAPVRQDCCS